MPPAHHQKLVTAGATIIARTSPELAERLRDRLTAVLELADKIRDSSHPTAEELAETLATSDAVAQANQAGEQLALLVGCGVRGDALTPPNSAAV